LTGIARMTYIKKCKIYLYAEMNSVQVYFLHSKELLFKNLKKIDRSTL